MREDNEEFEGWVSDPVGVFLSRQRFRRLEPILGGFVGFFLGLFGFRRKFEARYDEYLHGWDTRAAVVVSVEPLLVAAYADELDCSIVLEYPRWLVGEHELAVGSRLLSVCIYWSAEDADSEEIASDIVPGPAATKNWVNVEPLIAEFVSDELPRIEERKSRIAEAEWRRCEELAKAYLEHNGGRWRDGTPLSAHKPAGTAD